VIDMSVLKECEIGELEPNGDCGIYAGKCDKDKCEFWHIKWPKKAIKNLL
jgi:hypothetical protein